MKSTLKESNISLNNMHGTILPQTPVWIIKKTEVIVEVNQLAKTKAYAIIYQQKFHNISKHHPDHLCLYGQWQNGLRNCFK